MRTSSKASAADCVCTGGAGNGFRALQGSLGKDAFPIVPADFGFPDHDVPVNVNRGRQDDFRVANKRGGRCVVEGPGRR